MATLRDIKRRIKAVKNTQQITKAMKMVAASKLRKAQQRMMELRPYADKMRTVIARLGAGASAQESHPLLIKRPPKVVEVLVLTSDRGLCGAFNTNIMKASIRLVNELSRMEQDTVSGGSVRIDITTVGKKARDFFKYRNIQTRKSWVGLSGGLDYSNAKEIADEIMERYVKEEVDEVYLLYNRFKNVAQQEVTSVKLLPTEPVDGQSAADAGGADFIYEPSEEGLLGALLPKNIEIQVFRALLESQASEEAARMTAMENATKSAKDMIGTLTLQYNKARQATITAELMDIVGGVEALKAK